MLEEWLDLKSSHKEEEEYRTQLLTHINSDIFKTNLIKFTILDD